MRDNRKDLMSKEEKTMSSIITFVLVIIIGVIVFIASTYSLDETEQAVITTFGRATVNTGKGFQWNIPFIQHVKKIDTTIKGFPLGYTIDKEGNTHTVEDESMMITSDYNFVNIDFYITYRVSDPIKYVYASSNPELILKNLAQDCIRSVVSGYSVDSVLTTGKTEIQSNVTQMIKKYLEELDIGLALDNVSMQDAEPPTDEIQSAFTAVETAKQNKESAINEANKYRNEKLPLAEAKADKILKDAEALKEARINEAKGEVAKYNEMYEEYVKYPLITKQRMFYETMEELLPSLKVIIDNGSGNTTNILMDEDSKTGVIISEIQEAMTE